MGKYSNLQDDVFSIFNKPAWIAENIKATPINFSGGHHEFIRINIVASENSVNKTSIRGLLMIDIFTKAGEGPKRSVTIADKLDNYIQSKSVTTVTGNVTQFQNSTVGSGKTDSDNPSLFRTIYQIPFNFYGV
jgi:hypothetical protein